MQIKMNGSPEKDALMKKLLPKKPFTQDFIMPVVEQYLFPVLLKCLKKELKIYRNFPKHNWDYDLEQFDPRHGSKCFMGRGFFANGRGGVTDSDLILYRKSVGTIENGKWGECTILEIWAADHYVKYPDMVKNAFRYGWKKLVKMPELKFEFAPFINHSEGSQPIILQEDKDEEEAMEKIMLEGMKAQIKSRKRR